MRPLSRAAKLKRLCLQRGLQTPRSRAMTERGYHPFTEAQNLAVCESQAKTEKIWGTKCLNRSGRTPP